MDEREKQYSERRDIYRERLYATVQTIYAGFLAFDGMVLAVCSIGISLRQSALSVEILLLLDLTLLSVLLIMWNLFAFRKFYDHMGFRKIPKAEADWERENKDLLEQWEHFARCGKLRKKADRLLFVILVLRVVGIAIYAHGIIPQSIP